jgi:hypothetical protein
MKSVKYLIILLVLFVCANLFAQKLVLINLDNQKIRPVLDNLKLNILHQSSDQGVFCIDNESDLIRKGVPYSLLSQDIDSQPAYLISSKSHKDLNRFFDENKILYKLNNELIIQDNDLNMLELQKNGIKAIRLEKTNKIYKNISFTYQTDIKSDIRIDQNVINYINADSIAYYIQKLQDFQTRYALHPNRFLISEWIKNQFTRFGYTNVVLDSFYINVAGYGGIWQKNVIATLPGTENPDQYVIIGGHHDSILNSGYENAMIFAPGADDNASGSAAVLETARAMKLANYAPKTSIMFCTYAMEEFGLYGSKHHAQVSAQNQMKIRAMINNDMIASQISPNWIAHLQSYAGAEFLTEIAVDFADQDPTLAYTISNTSTSGSDSWSYWNQGYPAIFLAETEFSPYYHSTSDIIDYCNMPFARQMTRLAASMVMYMVEIPSTPDNFTVLNVGNGTQLRTQWDNITDQGTVNYNLKVKNLESGNIQEFNTSNNYYIINNLNNNTTYEISLTAVINNLSSITSKMTAAPHNLPDTPLNFTAIPTMGSNHLSWDTTNDMDLQYCRIFRKTLDQATPDIVANVESANNEYIFSPENDTTKYYYALAFVDMDENISELTDYMMVRPVTLSHGLAVLDDTFNGNGSIILPTDLQVDNFYNSILNGFNVSNLESSVENPFNIFDLAPYSCIIYHRNTSNVNDIVANIPHLKEYLDLGGKLIVSSYKPSQSFSTAPGYPVTFQNGSFVKDYLKIQSSNFITTARFQSAHVLNYNYQDIFIDSTKTHPNLQYRLMNIESITPTEASYAVYSYQSGYPENSEQAAMDDQIVGLIYNGQNYKTMTLTFPLYNMKEEQARNLIHRTMSIFGVPNSNDELNLKPQTAQLLNNYPNPFNPETNIPFYLKNSTTNVAIDIFNVKGQKIKSFILGDLNQGNHSVTWNGKDSKNKSQASGIYFYSLKTNGKITDTKKMLLLK